MKTRHLAMLMLLLCARLAEAGDAVFLPSDGVPDARVIAAILQGGQSKFKTRGVRLLPALETEARPSREPEQARALARTMDCDRPLAARQESALAVRSSTTGESFKIRGIRLLPAEGGVADTTAKAGPDCPESLPARAQASLGSESAAVRSDELPARAFALPIQFFSDSASLTREAYAQLDAIAAGIKLAGADLKLVIEGHTDAVGSALHNLLLSQQRAQAVKAYLVERHGLPAERLRVSGMGKNAPLNRVEPFAPENRRVEFRVDLG